MDEQKALDMARAVYDWLEGQNHADDALFASQNHPDDVFDPAYRLAAKCLRVAVGLMSYELYEWDNLQDKVDELCDELDGWRS